MAKKRLVVGNWKMFIEEADEAREFALTLRRKVRGLSNVEVWLAPSHTLLGVVAETLKSSVIKVGAQSASTQNEPQHTGEVSATMLKDVGALFSIVGHSERRAAGETNQAVRTQLEQVTATGLAPLLCVGEREREVDGEHFEFIEQQLTSALQALAPAAIKKLVVAYEPVWAIGKHAGDAMKPSELQEMVIFIRKMLTDLLGRRVASRIPILYGGSVEAANATSLLKEGGVSGFLVGHASAQVETFLPIIKASQN